jgi:hypothetical protein
MHGTQTRKSRKTRSAITSGARLFTERLDMRTPRGLRFQDLVDAYTEALGGTAKITETERAFVRSVAFMQCQLEDMELEYMKSGACGHDERLEYQRLANSQARMMKRLGLLDAKPSTADVDDEIDPLEYVKRGRSRQRLTEDEEKD